MQMSKSRLQTLRLPSAIAAAVTLPKGGFAGLGRLRDEEV